MQVGVLVMLKVLQCDTHRHIFRHLTSLEQASRVKDDPDTIVWLDLQNPTDEELTRLGEEFKLHPLAIEDASREHQRPKVEGYENFYFVVFYAIVFNTEKQANRNSRILPLLDVDARGK